MFVTTWIAPEHSDPGYYKQEMLYNCGQKQSRINTGPPALIFARVDHLLFK